MRRVQKWNGLSRLIFSSSTLMLQALEREARPSCLTPAWRSLLAVWEVCLLEAACLQRQEQILRRLLQRRQHRKRSDLHLLAHLLPMVLRLLSAVAPSAAY